MPSKPTWLKILAAIVILSTFTAGCSNVTPTSAPTTAPTTAPTAVPTINLAPTMSLLQTQAVQTFAANLTLNAPIPSPIPPTATTAPSATLAATNTPAVPPAPLPTATTAPVKVTLAPTPTLSTYNCNVFYIRPKFSDNIKAGTAFTGTWRVENTGTESWPGTEVNIVYLYGFRFQTGGDVINLGRSVGPTGTYTVNISMKAPTLPGPYFTQWAIQFGSLNICLLNLSVHVIN